MFFSLVPFVCWFIGRARLFCLSHLQTAIPKGGTWFLRDRPYPTDPRDYVTFNRFGAQGRFGCFATAVSRRAAGNYGQTASVRGDPVDFSPQLKLNRNQ